MKTLHSLTVLLLLSLSSFAQESAAPTAADSKPPLPAGPILRPLPTNAQWSVIFAAPGAKLTPTAPTPGEATPKKVKVITITKSGTARREVETDRAGQTWARWKVGDYEISYTPDGQYAVSTPGVRPDFPDFSWISAQNYTSAVKIGGQDCYIFQDTIQRPDYQDPVKVTAAVEIKTQLPVYLVLGTDPRTYRFSAAPAPLVIPPEVAAIVSARQKSMEAYTRAR